MKSRSIFLLLCAGLLALGACSNPFAPKKQKPDNSGEEQPASPATTPEIFFDNLHRAMRARDKDLYETLLDANFWFTETNCQGELVYANGREEELDLVGGTRDGSEPGIFGTFRKFDFEFTQIRREVELGRDYPEAYEGDPDGHPTEDWQVFYGRVQMLMTDESGANGYRVDQGMTFKLRQDDKGLWKLIRWIDDPLSGDCSGESSKPVAGRTGWAQVKQGR